MIERERTSSHRVRFVRAGLVVGAVLCASRVMAADALYLTWGGCPPSLTAASNASSSCLANAGESALYATFRVAQPLDSVVLLVLTLDIQHSAAVMPAWWQLAPGGCRYGSLAVDGLVAPADSCLWPWPTAFPSPKVLVQSYTVGQPRGGANQARVIVSSFVTPDQASTIDPDHVYLAARMALRNTATTTCAGCADPACLVLNSILVGRLPVNSRDVLVVTPGPGNANRATWQSAGASCAAVPVRATTWGAIKSLYR